VWKQEIGPHSVLAFSGDLHLERGFGSVELLMQEQWKVDVVIIIFRVENDSISDEREI
jgi:hypothetical protein